ncbi:MAG: transcriptional repressor LexA [Chloroflexota bacterium]|nr:transcriptional repressor LexA [Chloroflexota bacterium]
MDSRVSEPQQKILTFIIEYNRMEGCSPTNREIGEAVSMSSTGHVAHHLVALEKKGLITLIHGKSRGIRVNERYLGGLRLVGAIAAGAPLDYFPDTEQEPVDLNANIAGHTYALVVRGSSMIEDHITSGDLVVIDPDAVVDNGDIVVATRVDSETDGSAATLKRIYRENGQVRLQPANSEMAPIIVPAATWDREWKVQGKVIAVHRRCS